VTLEPAPPALGAATAPPTPAPSPASSRRRSWWVLAALALVTAVYLTGWSAWATLHTAERYEQLAPGASSERDGADFRLVSLTQSSQLADQTGARSQPAEPGAVFVVAVVEVVKQRGDATVRCAVDLLGPGGRIWTDTLPSVSRAVPYCSPDDFVVGRPKVFESVFVVPERYADRLLGVTLTSRRGTRPSAVLRPPG